MYAAIAACASATWSGVKSAGHGGALLVGGAEDRDVGEGDADDDGVGEEVDVTVGDDEIDVVTLEDESEPGVEPSDDVQPAS